MVMACLRVIEALQARCRDIEWQGERPQALFGKRMPHAKIKARVRMKRAFKTS